MELGTGRYLTSWLSLLTDWFPLGALVRRKGWVTHGRREAQCFHPRSHSRADELQSCLRLSVQGAAHSLGPPPSCPILITWDCKPC